MERMSEFYQSLIALPDISKWNISKVRFIGNMFECCESLLSLPDISKWNTSKIVEMDFCKSLSS